MAKKDKTKKQDFNKTASTAPDQKKKMPLGKKLAIGGGGLLVLLIIIVFNFPNYGTINYGICKVYVELTEPYPASIKWMWAWDDHAGQVGIGYKRVDPFGLEYSNEILCTIKTDEQGNLLLDKVDINGRRRVYPQENEELIKKFNMGLGSMFAYPPDLKMPADFPASIKDYQAE